MADRYIFDKRDMKKLAIKYGILFAIAFAVLLPLNMFVFVKYLSTGMGLFASVLIALVVILLGELVIYLYKNRKNFKK